MSSYARESLHQRFFFSDSITISSSSGVGGTTTFDLLKSHLPECTRFVSGGAAMRALAQQKGMSIEEFAVHLLDHPEVDRQIDRMIKEFGQQNFTLIEGRLPHILVSGFRVKLDCMLDERARRACLKANPEREPTASEIKLAANKLDGRDKADALRYDKLYPGWNWSNVHYDLCLRTDKLKPNEVVNEILQSHKEWKSSALVKRRLITGIIGL